MPPEPFNNIKSAGGLYFDRDHVRCIVYNCAGIHERNGSSKLERFRGATLNRGAILNRAVGSTLNRTVVKISINLAIFRELRRLNEDSLLSVDCIHLLRKLLGTTSVSKCNKSNGVVRDAITDQSTQHARKFVSRAVDIYSTRAHAHRYYRILPTCGRALNRSMNNYSGSV